MRCGQTAEQEAWWSDYTVMIDIYNNPKVSNKKLRRYLESFAENVANSLLHQTDWWVELMYDPKTVPNPVDVMILRYIDKGWRIGGFHR